MVTDRRAPAPQAVSAMPTQQGLSKQAKEGRDVTNKADDQQTSRLVACVQSPRSKHAHCCRTASTLLDADVGLQGECLYHESG